MKNEKRYLLILCNFVSDLLLTFYGNNVDFSVRLLDIIPFENF